MMKSNEIRLRRLEATEPQPATVIVGSTHEEAEARLQAAIVAGLPAAASATLIITGVPRSRPDDPGRTV